MPKFIYIPTPVFEAKPAKIEKHDRPGHVRILGVIDRLLLNPADADGWMHGVQNGRLKKYVVKSDYTRPVRTVL